MTVRKAAAPQSPSILVVDDDPEMASTVQEVLTENGYTVVVAGSGPAALSLLEQNPRCSIALVDLILGNEDGVAVMQSLRRYNQNLAVIIMTGYGTIENAVDAMKSGAEDFLTKPFDQEALLRKISRLAELFGLRERVAQLETGRGAFGCFEKIVFVSPAMQRVAERASTAAGSDATVLILGETGTGKELLARAIHAASPRHGKALIPVNCGALPRELVESELFGYRRGAFTGAHNDHGGVFSAAGGGTVFLDEISEMPKEAQVKLLRVIQEGELRPLGSPTPVKVDVRILAASNRPLPELREKHLREDLYFRLTPVVIELPPLRARREDIPPLAIHFAEQIGSRYRRQVRLTSSALDLLRAYDFPGNVRELENILEGLIALGTDSSQVLSDRELRPALDTVDYQRQSGAICADGGVLPLDQLERFAVQHALRVSGGNHSKAAVMLGISRDTLYRKLRLYRDGK